MDIEGLDGKALEDEVLRRDAEKTKEASAANEHGESVVDPEKTKREAAEEEALAQAAAGSRRNLLDDRIDRARD